jgi:hypothetical protein
MILHIVEFYAPDNVCLAAVLASGVNLTHLPCFFSLFLSSFFPVPFLVLFLFLPLTNPEKDV